MRFQADLLQRVSFCIEMGFDLLPWFLSPEKDRDSLSFHVVWSLRPRAKLYLEGGAQPLYAWT